MLLHFDTDFMCISTPDRRFAETHNANLLIRRMAITVAIQKRNKRRKVTIETFFFFVEPADSGALDAPGKCFYKTVVSRVFIKRS